MSGLSENLELIFGLFSGLINSYSMTISSTGLFRSIQWIHELFVNDYEFNKSKKYQTLGLSVNSAVLGSRQSLVQPQEDRGKSLMNQEPKEAVLVGLVVSPLQNKSRRPKQGLRLHQ